VNDIFHEIRIARGNRFEKIAGNGGAPLGQAKFFDPRRRAGHHMLQIKQHSVDLRILLQDSCQRIAVPAGHIDERFSIQIGKIVGFQRRGNQRCEGFVESGDTEMEYGQLKKGQKQVPPLRVREDNSYERARVGVVVKAVCRAR
jgi:hypothetical protein